MEHSKFVDAVADFDFVRDRETADAIVKAVLGILASSLTEPLARALTDFLPKPLDYERLRGHQAKSVGITKDLYIKTVSSQFKLSTEEACQVILAILRLTETQMGSQTVREVIHTMGFEIAP